jgi:beta-lactamase class A
MSTDHDPAGADHDPAGAEHDPAGAEHDPAGAEHDPAGAEHDPAGAEHDPAGAEQGGHLFDVVFRAARADGFLHARDLRTGDEVCYRADEPVVSASVFKLPVLVELFRRGDAGELDLSEPVTVPATGRVASPFGLSQMSDPVVMSLRDLATLMISVSDNVATDEVCARVGLGHVNALLGRLGLRGTTVELDCAGIFATLVEDLGVDTIEDIEQRLGPDGAAALRAMDPVATDHTTPREATRLLELIWSDRAAPPAACAEVRRVLGLQVWPHRLVSGFPEPDVRVRGKTGTLLFWRNEVGVVEYPNGERYAVAVFTRSWSLASRRPAVDAVIGTAGRLATEILRSRARG